MKKTPSLNQPIVVDGDIVEASLNLSLTKKEWLAIYNCLIRQNYNLGDAQIITPIVDKLFNLVKEENGTKK